MSIDRWIDKEIVVHIHNEILSESESCSVVSDSLSTLTRWTQLWVNSRSWWWTGRPGVLQSMGSQRVRHDWATELNWTDGWFMLSFDRKQQNSVKQISFNKKINLILKSGLSPNGLTKMACLMGEKDKNQETGAELSNPFSASNLV